MFQNNKKKQVKNSMLLHEFPVTSTQIKHNAFFLSQFEYCFLVRNFHSRSLNNRIKRLQERALFLVCKGTNSSIVELLEKENTFKIHRKNIKKRAIEIYEEKHKIAPKLIRELFQETEHPY